MPHYPHTYPHNYPCGCGPVGPCPLGMIEGKCVRYSGPYLPNLQFYSGALLDEILVKIDESLIDPIFFEDSETISVSGPSPYSFNVILSEDPDNALTISGGLYVPTPVIPEQVNADWNAVSGPAEILNKPTFAEVAFSGDYLDLTNTPNLATVALTGDYNDLINTPSDSDYIHNQFTAAQTANSWISGTSRSNISRVNTRFEVTGNWYIQGNENFLSIEFPTGSRTPLYLDDSGAVGINNTTPLYSLDVETFGSGTSTGVRFRNFITGSHLGTTTDNFITIEASGVLKYVPRNTMLSGLGTVTSVGLSSSDITIGGTNPVTTSGTISLTLPNINSNVGTFNNLTVNAKGQVTAASNVSYLTAVPTLSQVLTAGDTANDNITLGGIGVPINFSYRLGRTVGSVDRTALFDLNGDPSIGYGARIGSSGADSVRYLIIPDEGSTAYFSPDGMSSTYQMWHENNHPAGVEITQSLVGNTFLASITSNTSGHLTAVTTKSITTTDIPEGDNLYFTQAASRAALSQGTGISYNSSTGVITNSAPDQVVTLTQGTNITITGTYPSFTINATGGGGGSVESVGLSAPSVFSVSGSPVTTTGTLALTFATGQTQNQVLATPNGSSGAVGLRSLVAADIPSLDAAKITTGIFGIARGGTGLSSLGTANQLIRVNAGASALEYFTPSYITGNQTITLSGDVTGSGTTSITTTVTNAAVRGKLSQGTGISYNSSTGVITNSSPDQTVTLSNGTGISVTGTYPSFTITNTSPNTNQNLNQVLTTGNTSTLSATVGDLISDEGSGLGRSRISLLPGTGGASNIHHEVSPTGDGSDWSISGTLSIDAGELVVDCYTLVNDDIETSSSLIAPTIQITGGTPVAGEVWTATDSSGNGQWAAPAAAQITKTDVGDGTYSEFSASWGNYVVVMPSGNGTIDIAPSYPGYPNKIAFIYNPTNFTYELGGTPAVAEKLMVLLWNSSGSFVGTVPIS